MADIFMREIPGGTRARNRPGQLTCPNTHTDHSDQSVPVLFAPLFLEGPVRARRKVRARRLGLRLARPVRTHVPADPGGDRRVRGHPLRQRTREGMAIARQNGKLKGKQPKLRPAQDREIRRMHDSGDYNVTQIVQAAGPGAGCAGRRRPCPPRRTRWGPSGMPSSPRAEPLGAAHRPSLYSLGSPPLMFTLVSPSRRAVKALARSAASRQEMPAGDTASGQLALLFPGQSKMNMTSQDPVQGTPVPPAHALSEPRAGPFWEASTRMPRDGPQPARSARPRLRPASNRVARGLSDELPP